MKSLTKLLLATSISLTIGATAFAAVTSITEERTNWSISFPKVSIEKNIKAQKFINKDLQSYYDNLKTGFKDGSYSRCEASYKVHYEDENIVSISLQLAGYPEGGCGNHTRTISLVYNKKSGEKLPLSNYVHISPEDLEQQKYSNTYSFESNNPFDSNNLHPSPIKEVPKNYFLPGDGTVCIVFNPYDLSAGASGALYIKLKPEYINYLNKKNK